MTSILPQVKAQAERLRQDYDIQDQAIAQELRNGLAAIALLQRQPEEARRLIAESRSVSSKAQQKFVGMIMFDAGASVVDGPGSGRCQRGAARIRTILSAADPHVVRNDVLKHRAELEAVGDAFAVAAVKAEIDPAAAADNGRISARDGLQLAAWRAQIEIVNACRAELSGEIQRWAADASHRPSNIWTEREPDADRFANAKPVVVAVWDSGIDQVLFAGQLAVDPKEPIDGIDNDGNGIVDDWNGPTYDIYMRPDASPLKRPSAELASQMGFQEALLKGDNDLQTGLDTPEARLAAVRSREAPVAEQERDAWLWQETRGRSHGTAVASEIADGNSFVRLFSVSAQPWGHSPEEVVVDEALNDRWVAAVDRLTGKLHAARVRIVNMSWSYTVDEIAGKLTRYGGVTDRAQATARAKTMWAKADAAMRRLLTACPDILFINSAGNSDQTDEILASTPQTIKAPNLLVVGAADTSGLLTGFTTFGKGVPIYAWGEDVPLRVPGGMRMTMSGTSMSAPLVTRAAAQMLAINPRLKPAQLIDALLQTATSSTGSLKLLHAGKAVDWAGTGSLVRR